MREGTGRKEGQKPQEARDDRNVGRKDGVLGYRSRETGWHGSVAIGLSLREQRAGTVRARRPLPSDSMGSC